MTLYELKQMQMSRKRWSRFIFLSENQSDYRSSEPVKLGLFFDQMLVGHTPGLCYLYFHGVSGWLLISFVERVNITPHVLGDILAVQCTNGECFTVVAQ